MNYKVNDGIGAVLCDKCRVIIDEGISYEDALEIYGLGDKDAIVLCRKCKEKDWEKKRV